jgi:hypothetical protein
MPVLLVLGALLVAGCTGEARSGAGAPEPSDPPAYSLSACRPLALGEGAAWWNDAAQSLVGADQVGYDVAASARLPGDRWVWVFGDTSRLISGGAVVPTVRNSMSFYDKGCAAIVQAPGGGAIVPDRRDDVGYWPMSILVGPSTAEGTSFTVMMQRVRSIGVAAFVNLGAAVAEFTVPLGGAPQLTSVTDVGADDDDVRRPTWGAASYDAGDGWWYLYGTANPAEPLVFGWSVRVARVPAGRAPDLGSWQYWDGTGWSVQPADAAQVLAPVGGVSQTFSVVERGSRMYAVSKVDGYLGDSLGVWSMKGPRGPFGDVVSVARIPTTSDPEVLRYMALAQPDLPTRSPARLLVSVSRNTNDLAELARRPLLYRPYYVEIDLPPVASTRELLGPPARQGLPSGVGSADG